MLRQNGRHFADDIFRCIFMNEKICILIKISLKFVPKGPINNNPAWCLDNGLVPNKRQAIIWTNAAWFSWPIYVALGGDELSSQFSKQNPYNELPIAWPFGQSMFFVCMSKFNLSRTHRWVNAKRRNSSALAMEWCLSCTNPLTWSMTWACVLGFVMPESLQCYIWNIVDWNTL